MKLSNYEIQAMLDLLTEKCENSGKNLCGNCESATDIVTNKPHSNWTCGNEECQQILSEHLEADVIGAKLNLLQHKECCNECGHSVEFGSGNYVNRIPSEEDTQENIDNNKEYPHGAWICAECEEKFEEDIDRCKKCDCILDEPDGKCWNCTQEKENN